MRLPAAAALAALGLTAPAFGADGDATGPPVDTMVVKASLVAVPADRVGSSVTVVTREDIDRREAPTAVQVLRDVPGVALAQSGGAAGQAQLRLWGAEGSHTLVLVDGVEANDPAGNDEFSFEHLTAFDVERIEVIRGPQSALWGSDALAGVVNVVTRRAREPFEAALFAEGGALGTTNWGGRVGGASGPVSVTASASHYDTDGSNVSRTGSEADGYRNTTAGLRVDWDATPALHLDASGRHTSARAQFDAVDYVTGLPHDTDDYTDTTFDYVRGGGRTSLLDDRWRHDLHVAWTGSATRSYAGGASTGSTGADKVGVYYQTSYNFAGRDGADTDRLLTLAVDHEEQSFSQRGPVYPGASPGDPPYDPNQDQRLHGTGVGAEFLWSPVAPLALSFGGRYDANSDFRDAVTWRTTASWKAAGATRLHASVGTGQKAPTFLERYGYYPGQFVGNPDLKPVHSLGWDAGVEQRLGGDRLLADVTYFHARVTDEIDPYAWDSAANLPTAVNKPGVSPRQGIQVALTLQASAQYSFSGNYTYTDAREPDGAGGLQRELRRPYHSAGLTANGNWLAGRLNLNVNASYTGAREDVHYYADPVTYDPLSERVTLGEYTRLNAALTWQATRAVALYGRLDNALDHVYEDVYGYRAPGRTWVAGLRMAFGP